MRRLFSSNITPRKRKSHPTRASHGTRKSSARYIVLCDSNSLMPRVYHIMSSLLIRERVVACNVIQLYILYTMLKITVSSSKDRALPCHTILCLLNIINEYYYYYFSFFLICFQINYFLQLFKLMHF